MTTNTEIKQWHERTTDLSDQGCIAGMKSEIAELRAALASQHGCEYPLCKSEGEQAAIAETVHGAIYGTSAQQGTGELPQDERK